MKATIVCDGSLPTRERGLKFYDSCRLLCRFTVAPYAGAWIEISLTKCFIQDERVAPYAGAWIEIDIWPKTEFRACGRSLRGSVD